MDGSSGNECSRTLLTEENENGNEEESEASFGATGKSKDRGCSSISTIEENEKKPTVRPYVRSKTPRLRWTHDLHLRFVQAIARLGGQERATPKLVLHLMNVRELNIAHVKSHLQMYRGKKIDDSTQVMNHHSTLVDGGDQNVYNLRKHPVLHSYNQRQNSTFSYENWRNVSFMGRTSGIDVATPILYGSFGETILGGSYGCSVNRDLGFCVSSFNEQLTWRSHEVKEELGSTNSQMRTTMKRKASDCNLDLNLTLGIKSRSGERQRGLEDEGYESNLSLSLYSPSSLKLNRSKEGDRRDNETGASTLDLTI